MFVHTSISLYRISEFLYKRIIRNFNPRRLNSKCVFIQYINTKYFTNHTCILYNLFIFGHVRIVYIEPCYKATCIMS